MKAPTDVPEVRLFPDRDVCDFCADEFPYKVYPCEDFPYVVAVAAKSITTWSEGDWVACEECSKLVDSNSHTELIIRSWQHDLIKNGPGYEDMRYKIKETLLTLFQTFRKGEPYLYGSDRDII